MTSPVQLSDLDVAPSADDADVTLLRKGLTDYQCPISLIRTINVPALPDTTSINSTDYLLLNQGGVNKKIYFSQAGLLKGTQAWFYQNIAPALWSIVPGTGDRLLAVKGGSSNYNINGGTQNNFGDWLIPPTTLTIDQIPAHQHEYQLFEESAGSNQGTLGARRARVSAGTNGVTAPRGGGQAHTHPASYRPAANIGIICIKNQ
jgi:hypothetical protein